MSIRFRRYETRFHITRVVDDRLVGYWTSYVGETPEIIRDFENWFEWARWKAQRSIDEQRKDGE